MENCRSNTACQSLKDSGRVFRTILSNEPVMTAVLKKADDRMHTNIDRQINYELSKL
jgi:hypothetical protein